jgi:hypothetical protein
MSDEISNKTLAMLLVVAIVVSLAGTFMSLNKLATLRFPVITGMASDTGTADVEIEETSSIVFTVSAIDFGTGHTNGSQASTCSLWSDSGGGGYTAADICVNFTGSGYNSLQLQNDGNMNLSVNLSVSNDGSTLIGGSGPMFRFMGEESGGNPCVGTLQTAWTELVTGASGTSFCDEWDAADANTIYVHLNLTIPVDASQGVTQSTITAEGTTT